MGKKRVRQWLVLLAVVITLVINALAEVLPINQLGTGQISDQFKVFFVPAGYVFSIWGLIYLGLIAVAVYQFLPGGRDSARMQRIFVPFLLSSIANCTWLFLWHYQLFYWTLAAMLLLLVSLIVIYLRLRQDDLPVSRSEKWMVHIPFSIYLGWVSVATIANFSDVLDYAGFKGGIFSGQVWAAIMLGVAVLLGLIMTVTRRDVAFLAVFLWAFTGIAARFSQEPVVATAAWVASGAVVVLIVISLILQRRKSHA
jgi:hypothetical protein